MTRSAEGLDGPTRDVVRGTGKQLGEFRTFIPRGNVVDLAVGVVIGTAFTAAVRALVRDFITPLMSVGRAGFERGQATATATESRLPLH